MTLQIPGIGLRCAQPELRLLLRSHIQQSKLEVRKITLHRLHEARSVA